MPSNEVFLTSVRSAGDYGGVFEYDGDTSYFYLYHIGGADGDRVVGAVHIGSGEPDYSSERISISWADNENIVYLQIESQVCAAFECTTRVAFGGKFSRKTPPPLPVSIRERIAG